MSDKKNSLEQYVVEELKEIDPSTRQTKGSGCKTEIGDISNKFFFIECKIKHVKENIIIDYKKDWLNLVTRLPLNSKKIPIVVIENKYGDKFVTLKSDDFFNLIKENLNE